MMELVLANIQLFAVVLDIIQPAEHYWCGQINKQKSNCNVIFKGLVLL